MSKFPFAGLCVLAFAWPSGANAQKIPFDATKIEAHIEAVMASSRIPGVAVGIVHENRIVYLNGFGDDGNGGRVAPSTLFDLASVSKPFTALAIMQLVEDGKIDLDQPLRTYLPDFLLADADAAESILVRHLLSHVSGLSTALGRQHFFIQNNSPNALAQYVQDLKDVRPTAPVGTKFQYSNANFTLLARLVEVASEMQFEQYVRERILTPLGMMRTCILPHETPDRAIGHRLWFGWPVAYSGLPTSRIHLGATGIYSSAEELSRFLIAQLNGGRLDGNEVLSPAGVAMMHRPAVEIQPELHYAMGWDARGTPNGLYLGHGGDSAEFHTDLIMCPADRWGVVVLMNANGGDGAGEMVRLARDVLDLSRGRQVSSPRPAPFALRHFRKILFALLAVQVVSAVLFYRRVQRWRNVAEERPRHWRWMWSWHVVVVFLNLALAYFLLIGLPEALEVTIRLGMAFAPDSTLLVILSSGFALVWSVIRTVLMIRGHRLLSRPVVVTA